MTNETKREQCQMVLKLCREKCPGADTPTDLTDDVMRWILEAGTVLSEMGQTFTALFDRVAGSDELSGRTGRFVARFGWMMKPQSVKAILSGAYDNRGKRAKKQPSFDIEEYERMALRWRPVYRGRED